MKKILKHNKRLLIQITVLLVVIVSSINHYLISINKSIPWISESIFHYICPTCGVTSIYQFIASPTLWVEKIKSILGIIIGVSIILTLIFGPVICGFICPFGAIQDLTARVGKKIFKDKYNHFIKKELDNKLKFTRYLSLILAIILTATSSVMILEAINPYHAFLGIFNKKPISLVGVFILFLVILISLFVQRPWCKYLCPYGAFLGIFNKFKVFRVIREKESCLNCKRCDKECPMGIEIHESEAVRDIRCISCLDCLDKNICPKSNTIEFTSKDIESEQVNIEY
ncbi:4Fe-4S binding protein [Romboutsia lituseburensis]|uniref:4Fe-4S binding domain-containing protein n=1 Tax=Romboutsia lituseburensis DSM 797 TaxID=1121325 RepID=A0A1G9IZ32_9FIRM|nr:4Fe-4S binding protein [Romboutsia lituseburensis]CEH33700.1 Polyferredoxin [Romboutsia lituseburensis]SDL30362.1 4Fe-4S binding domain-containing protein [Romboutsia lituseburensis DSM 797]